MSTATIIHSAEELGGMARVRRETLGLGLRAVAPIAGTGTRFLSEFERGKDTAEFSKVLSALNATGLDLAVIQRRGDTRSSLSLSQQVDTEFPYDWSNSQMDEGVFIRKVLQARRFNDLLRTVAFFGLERVHQELVCIDDNSELDKTLSILTRIQKGMILAMRAIHETTPRHTSA